jgi:ribonucleoside-diphosphate reductase alpha chain
MKWEDFKDVYMRAWQGGAKGCTTFNVGGKRFGILATNEDGAGTCKIDTETGRRDCE